MAENGQVQKTKVISEEQQNIKRAGMTISSFLSVHGIENKTLNLSGAEDETGNHSSTASSILSSKDDRKYAIGNLLARGGMGAILSAKDLNIHRDVAMKVMLDATELTADNIVRFIEEAQVTGQLEHPCIVPVHELGIDDKEQVFYTMKLIKGVNLDDILSGIRDGKAEFIAKYPLNRLLNIFLKICEGMSFAHHRKVIHRDLKPENIMVGDYGEVLVMDWGLSKVLETRGQQAEDREQQRNADVVEKGRGMDEIESQRFQESGGPMLTMDGTIMGTPGFLSPEQAYGKVNEMDAAPPSPP